MKNALKHLRKADAVLGALIGRVGPYSIAYSPPDFSTIARCITYQQLSGKAASRIYRRLESSLPNGGVTPAALLSADPGFLRSIGFSRQKIAYLRDFAAACLSGEIDLRSLADLEDAEVIRALTQRKGIGPWTAHMYLIFALRRPDVLPTGDLGIRVALRRAYSLEELPSPGVMEQLAAPWRPYRTVACWYLWRSLGDGAGLDPVVD